MLKLVIHSFKGGPGKSTIASNVAVSLSLAGKRVGIIDMDLAGPGLHVIFGLLKRRMKFTLADALQNRCSVREAAIDLTKTLGIKKGRLVFVPAAFNTQGIVGILQKGYELASLQTAIRELINAYSLDYLIIDTRPGIDESTMLAIGLSDAMLLITRMDKQDIFGTAVTLEVARAFKKPVFLIANMIPPGDGRNLEKNLVDMFRVPVIAQLPYDADVHRSLSSDIFVLRYPEHDFTFRIKSLTSALLGLKREKGARAEPSLIYSKNPVQPDHARKLLHRAGIKALVDSVDPTTFFSQIAPA